MKKCHDCGHEHPTMASASRKANHTFNDGISKVWEERHFCHESDHSCYECRFGNYWDDRPIISTERAPEIIQQALRGSQ